MLSLFLSLVAYAGPNDHQWNRKLPDNPVWEKVAVPSARLSQRLQGRVLGTVIPKEMSKESVDFLLGNNRSVELTGVGMANGILISRYSYDRLGIDIFYRDNRVHHIRFLPVFEK
jgi:hypothetical protein